MQSLIPCRSITSLRLSLLLAFLACLCTTVLAPENELGVKPVREPAPCLLAFLAVVLCQFDTLPRMDSCTQRWTPVVGRVLASAVMLVVFGARYAVLLAGVLGARHVVLMLE